MRRIAKRPSLHKASLSSLRCWQVLAVLAGLALGLLSGCAANQTTRSDAATAARGELPAIEDAWSAVRARVGEVRVGWIDAFGDARLTQLVREAQQKNHNLQAAAANVERSWALARQASAALVPDLTLQGGAQRSGPLRGQGTANRLNLGVQSRWEVDLWGRVRSGERAATASAQAAQADYRFSQHSLAAGVARAYFLVIEADLQEKVIASVVEALTETKRITLAQYANGFATAYDASLARSDLASAQDRLISAQLGQRDAKRALEVLVGRYPRAKMSVSLTLPTMPPPPPAGLPSDILSRRPDLLAAERRVAAAMSSRKQALAARLPQISLTGAIGGVSDDLSLLLSPANLIWSAASNLLAPLFDGGGRRATVALTRADQKAAIAAYAQAALEAFTEVETALDQGSAFRDRKRELEIAAKEYENAYRLALLRFKEGETSLLDVLVVQQRVFGAQSSLITVKRNLLGQYIDLSLALGGDWRCVDCEELKELFSK